MRATLEAHFNTVVFSGLEGSRAGSCGSGECLDLEIAIDPVAVVARICAMKFFPLGPACNLLTQSW